MPGDEGVSFDPNLYLLDCRKQKQITVFNAVEQTGPSTRDYRLTALGAKARNAAKSGGLDAPRGVLTAAARMANSGALAHAGRGLRAAG